MLLLQPSRGDPTWLIALNYHKIMKTLLALAMTIMLALLVQAADSEKNRKGKYRTVMIGTQNNPIMMEYLSSGERVVILVINYDVESSLIVEFEKGNAQPSLDIKGENARPWVDGDNFIEIRRKKIVSKRPIDLTTKALNDITRNKTGSEIVEALKKLASNK